MNTDNIKFCPSDSPLQSPRQQRPRDKNNNISSLVDDYTRSGVNDDDDDDDSKPQTTATIRRAAAFLAEKPEAMRPDDSTGQFLRAITTESESTSAAAAAADTSALNSPQQQPQRFNSTATAASSSTSASSVAQPPLPLDDDETTSQRHQQQDDLPSSTTATAAAFSDHPLSPHPDDIFIRQAYNKSLFAAATRAAGNNTNSTRPRANTANLSRTAFTDPLASKHEQQRLREEQEREREKNEQREHRRKIRQQHKLLLAVASPATTSSSASPAATTKKKSQNDQDDDESNNDSFSSSDEAAAQRAAQEETLLASLSTVDYSSLPRYGFGCRTEPAIAVREEARAAQLLRQAHAAQDTAFRSVIRSVSLLAQADSTVIDTLKKLCRKHGTPPHLRSIVWPTITRVAWRLEEFSDQGYGAALAKGIPEFVIPKQVIQSIEQDLLRTFPEHPYFKRGAEGNKKLRHVLLNLWRRSPCTGYCQSFNYLVATFLLALNGDVEATLWTMIYIFEQLIPCDVYNATLTGVKIDQRVLADLIRQHLPRLASHFDATGYDVAMLIPVWLMAGFTNAVPFETALAIWDFVFATETNKEPQTPALLTVALAILKINQEAILAVSEASDIAMLLSQLTDMLFDWPKLLRAAAELSALVTGEAVAALRRKHRALVQQELVQKQNAQAALKSKAAAAAAALARGTKLTAVRNGNGGSVGSGSNGGGSVDDGDEDGAADDNESIFILPAVAAGPPPVVEEVEMKNLSASAAAAKK